MYARTPLICFVSLQLFRYGADAVSHIALHTSIRFVSKTTSIVQQSYKKSKPNNPKIEDKLPKLRIMFYVCSSYRNAQCIIKQLKYIPHTPTEVATLLMAIKGIPKRHCIEVSLPHCVCVVILALDASEQLLPSVYPCKSAHSLTYGRSTSNGHIYISMYSVYEFASILRISQSRRDFCRCRAVAPPLIAALRV